MKNFTLTLTILLAILVPTAVSASWISDWIDRIQQKQDTLIQELPEESIVLGAPATTTTRNLEPFTDSTYYAGTVDNAYLQGSFDELCLTGDSCQTSWPTGGDSFWVDAGGSLYPKDGDFIEVPYINATSTTATSTFSGDINFGPTGGINDVSFIKFSDKNNDLPGILTMGFLSESGSQTVDWLGTQSGSSNHIQLEIPLVTASSRRYTFPDLTGTFAITGAGQPVSFGTATTSNVIATSTTATSTFSGLFNIQDQLFYGEDGGGSSYGTLLRLKGDASKSGGYLAITFEDPSTDITTGDISYDPTQLALDTNDDWGFGSDSLLWIIDDVNYPTGNTGFVNANYDASAILNQTNQTFEIGSSTLGITTHLDVNGNAEANIFTGTSLTSTSTFPNSTSTRITGIDETNPTYYNYELVTWGDSLTSGVGATYPYPFQMEHDISEHMVVNNGVGGYTSTQIETDFLATEHEPEQIHIIWAGRNNYAASSTVLSDIADMIADIPTTQRYLVMSVLNRSTEHSTTTEYADIIALNNALASTYPNNYLDIRQILVDSYDTGDAQDTTDNFNDVPPTSLRADTLHLNDAGYAIVATEVYGWVQTNYLTGLEHTLGKYLTAGNLEDIFASPPAIGSTTPPVITSARLYNGTSTGASPNYILYSEGNTYLNGGVDIGSNENGDNLRFFGGSPLIFTNGYASPLLIDASIVSFQSLSNGKVGVGDSTPDYTLEVQDSTSNGYFGITTSSDGDILEIDSTGQLGLGDATPTYKLDIAGNGRFTSLVDASNFIATSTSATSTFAGGLTIDTSDFVVDPDANRIGIGTSTPQDNVHIESSSSNVVIRLNKTGTSNAYTRLSHQAPTQTQLQAINPTGAVVLDFDPIPANGSDGSFRFFRSTNTNGAVYFQIYKGDGSGTSQARIGGNIDSYFAVDNNGVGIGDTTPDYKLEIQGSDGSGYFAITNSVDGDIFEVDSTGNFGFGTSTPRSLLSVGSGQGNNTDSYLQIDSESGAPAAGDCDTDLERGRMIHDYTNFVLYICGGATRGWDTVSLTD